MVTDMTLPVSAKERLRMEADAWLTTMRSDGQPQSSVIWFWWDNGVMWIRSQPTAGKIANIRRQPRVSVNLNSNGHGDGVVTFEGTAELVDDFPTAVRVAYIAKYEHHPTGSADDARADARRLLDVHPDPGGSRSRLVILGEAEPHAYLVDARVGWERFDIAVAFEPVPFIKPLGHHVASRHPEPHLAHVQFAGPAQDLIDQRVAHSPTSC
jgi:PPOX class probable F420-dependent enzyme